MKESNSQGRPSFSPQSSFQSRELRNTESLGQGLESLLLVFLISTPWFLPLQYFPMVQSGRGSQLWGGEGGFPVGGAVGGGGGGAAGRLKLSGMVILVQPSSSVLTGQRQRRATFLIKHSSSGNSLRALDILCFAKNIL